MMRWFWISYYADPECQQCFGTGVADVIDYEEVHGYTMRVQKGVGLCNCVIPMNFHKYTARWDRCPQCKDPIPHHSLCTGCHIRGLVELNNHLLEQPMMDRSKVDAFEELLAGWLNRRHRLWLNLRGEKYRQWSSLL